MSEQRRYWLHRISHESDISYPLLEKGYLTLGWREFSKNQAQEGNHEILSYKNGNKSYDSFKKLLKGWEERRNRVNIWNNLQYKVGDIIVVPMENKKFGIYEVKEEVQLINDVINKVNDLGLKLPRDLKLEPSSDKNYVDIGFITKVDEKIIGDRIDVDPILQSTMKYQGASKEIRGLDKEINNAMVGTKRKLLYGSSKENLVDMIKENLLSKLNDNEFEKLITWYMYEIGANIVENPGKRTKDSTAENIIDEKDISDADIIATFENLNLTIYVQAKKHTGKSSSWGVEQIKNFKRVKDDKSMDDYSSYISDRWVISTADNFSSDAIKLAQSTHVRLINGTKFSEMLLNVGLKPSIDLLYKGKIKKK